MKFYVGRCKRFASFSCGMKFYVGRYKRFASFSFGMKFYVGREIYISVFHIFLSLKALCEVLWWKIHIYLCEAFVFWIFCIFIYHLFVKSLRYFGWRTFIVHVV